MKQRTLTRYFLTLSLLTVLIASPFSTVQALELSLDSQTDFKIGDTITVDVTIDSVLSLYGIALDLAYNQDVVTVADADQGTEGIQPDVVEGSALNGDGEATFIRSALVDTKQGRLVVGNVRSGQVSGIDLSGNQTIMTVSFKAKAPGTAQISCHPKRTVLRNSDLHQIAIDSLLNTTVTITPHPGDINGTGSIDLTDVITALLITAGANIGEQQVYTSADVNGDNIIGIAEAIYAINQVVANP